MHEREPLHLIDATMFWNASGGVRRYVGAKRRWLQRHTAWRHTVATPAVDVDGDDDAGSGAAGWPGPRPFDHTIARATGRLRIPSLPLPGSGGAYRFPWRRRASARALREAAPDLIESADPYRLAWAALDAARARGVPAVAFCHSNLERMAALAAGRAGARAARRYAARLYDEFDLVLAPSRAMVGHLRDWGVRRAAHQPLGVDTAVFHPARRSEDWRRALPVPPDARLLVYAGRFAPEKELGVLAEAVRRLGAPHWLLAIGDGPAPPAGERVIVLPALADSARLATVLASADVFVHAGAQETFGLAALEALACGTPLVCRAAEGLAELVDERVGQGIDPGLRGDKLADAFAQAIAAALSRDRDALRAAARRRAQAQDWERVLLQLWRHYERLLGARAAA